MTTAKITAQELKKWQDENRDFVLMNALPKESFTAKRIPGSINIVYSDIDTLAGKIMPDKQQALIVYCSGPSCKSSHEVAEKFTRLGYSNVYHYEGGLQEWLQEKYELTRNS